MPVSQLIRDPQGHPSPLSPLGAVRVARQIASGLVVAHKNGVLHRDLKPENILVVHPGEAAEHVKVVDFGIAKLTEGGSTETHSLVGTPTYMAPEQFTAGANPRRADGPVAARRHPPRDADRAPALRDEAGRQRDDHRPPAALPRGPGPSARARPARRSPSTRSSTATSPGCSAPTPRRGPRRATEVTEELTRIEQTLSPNYAPTGSFPLLEALCAEPSAGAWWALLS